MTNLYDKNSTAEDCMEDQNKLSQEIQQSIEKQLKSGFVSQEEHERNFEIQKQGANQVLELFDQHGGSTEKPHPIEFFFYSDSIAKAHQLAAHLRKLNYELQVDTSTGSPNQYLINGWTPPMNAETIGSWSELMCKTGARYDCKFDGWGMFIE